MISFLKLQDPTHARPVGKFATMAQESVLGSYRSISV